MNFHRLVMPVVLLAPLSLGFAGAHAQVSTESTTTTTTTIITTDAPAPKETVAAPEGYSSCTTVAAGWRNTVWHPEYKVCRYDTKNTTVEGEAWIAGHWECSQYTVGAESSECSNWDWAAGRWVKTYAEIQ